MKSPIERYFKVGIVSFMAYPELLRGESTQTETILKKITGDGYFSAIEVSWVKDPEERKRVSALLKASHMTLCYGAQPRLLTTGLNPNDLNEEGRRAAEATLLEAIDEAESMGCGGIAFLSGKWEEETREASYVQLKKTTEALCRYALTKGMTVELEVFDFDIAKKSLIGPAKFAGRFAGEIRERYGNFGLLVDLSHIPMCYEKAGYTVRTLREYITHFHIGNTVIGSPTDEGYGDEHQRFGFPGGSNDVEAVLDFLRVLQREGFFKEEEPYVLSFEVKPWKEEDPDTVVANAKRVLTRAWAMLEEGEDK